MNKPPGRTDWGEVEVHVRVALEPRGDLGGRVGGQVVQHDVHVGAGVRLDRLLQEVQEVRPVAGGLALAEHLAGGTFNAANRFVVPCRT
jgi:hypothetical protein